MKDSRIEWIGPIPEHWSTNAVKRLFYRKKSEAHQEDPVVLSLARTGVRVRDISNNEGQLAESYYNYNPVEPGDLLINPMDLYSGANCSISEVSGVISPAYINLKALDGVDPLYYDFYFKVQYWTMAFFAHGKGVSFDNRWTLNQDTLMNFPVIVPPYEEQLAIGKYLKGVSKAIDDQIEAVKNSIEELKTYRSSIIDEAVTKGINPHVELKDSGVNWIGKMPVHWKDVNPKKLFAQRKDRAIEGERQLTASQQLGVIYQDEYMEITGNKIVTVEKDFSILKHVEAGDFVISMRSFQGGLEYSEKTGSISSAYVMLIPNLEYVYPRFFKWLLKSSGYIDALRSTSDLVRDGQAMRYSNFAQVRLVMLPVEEQEQIANYLDSICNTIDSLIEEKKELLEDLEKYRRGIVFDAVTGKIKI